eukprot:TRINITY_DN871_c0_g1_i2.p1 TRINITY_DN871_c0_g1~~TRINITY_DN871_c0_g1_i2.p1  ORF type:complete len:343 (+),score=60.52 TRINITY_DN871_c0_g1_i2:78-1106(+)
MYGVWCRKEKGSSGINAEYGELHRTEQDSREGAEKVKLSKNSTFSPLFSFTVYSTTTNRMSSDGERAMERALNYRETSVCPLCRSDVGTGVFTFHLVSCCYKDFASSGLPVPCTCPIHKGKGYHDWGDNNNNNTTSPSSSSTPPSRRTHPLPSAEPQTNPEILDRIPVTPQLLGTCCFACGHSKSVSYIKGKFEIGAYRLIRLCKQSEMKELYSRSIVTKWIEAEVKKVRDSNDARPSFNPQESPNDAPPKRITTGHNCSGYVHNDTVIVCELACDSVISFTEKKKDGATSTLYFCTVVHFFRWYVKHRTGKAEKANKTDKTIGKRGRKENSDNEGEGENDE